MNCLRFCKAPHFSALALSLLIAVAFAASPRTVLADTVTLKSGEIVEGKVVTENAEIVQVEVEVSGSIKETKTFPTADVASIEKTAPDKVSFAKIMASVPTPDLLSSADYEAMIRSGARRFLATYPESEHAEDVQKVLTQLEEEKVKVQLGSIKLDGKWIPRGRAKSLSLRRRSPHSSQSNETERRRQGIPRCSAIVPIHRGALPGNAGSRCRRDHGPDDARHVDPKSAAAARQRENSQRARRGGHQGD